MADTVAAHRRESPDRVRCAVVTVSDSRDASTDRGGDLVCELLTASGHEVVLREIVPDEPDQLRSLVEHCVQRDDTQIVLITGGTGISARDQTSEALQQLLSKELPGYGELFRWLSYQEIGPEAMLSRATGGLVGQVPVLTMPGSPAAIRLALEALILPELGHLIAQASK